MVCLSVCSVDYRNHHLGLGHSTEEAAATVQQEYTMHGYSLNCYKKIIVPIYYGGKWVGLWWLTGHCSSQSASESACVVWHDSKVRHTKPATTAVFVTRSVIFAPLFFQQFSLSLSHLHLFLVLSCFAVRHRCSNHLHQTLVAGKGKTGKRKCPPPLDSCTQSVSQSLSFLTSSSSLLYYYCITINWNNQLQCSDWLIDWLAEQCPRTFKVGKGEEDYVCCLVGGKWHWLLVTD